MCASSRPPELVSSLKLEEAEPQVPELLGQSHAKHWGEALAEVAGSVREGLPEDLALNHDHYLHGAARR